MSEPAAAATIDWEAIRSGAIALSAVIGVITFLVSYLWQRSQTKANEIRDWQRTVVAEIFQTHDGEAINFGEVLQKYQAEAPSYERYNIRGNDLSKQALRKIVLELIQFGVIEQYSQNKFCLRMPGAWLKRDDERLKKMNEASMEMMIRTHEIVDERNAGQRAAKNEETKSALASLPREMYSAMAEQSEKDEQVVAYFTNLIHEDAEKYDVHSLSRTVVEQFDMSVDVAKYRIRRAIESGMIEELDSGLLRKPVKVVEVN